MVDSPEGVPVHSEGPTASPAELGGESSIAGTTPSPEPVSTRFNSASQPLTLDQGRRIQRARTGRIIGATIGRRPR